MLKNSKPFGRDYFNELPERIREIRASGRWAYQKIADVFEQCSYDYDKNRETTKAFYAFVQNKLRFAFTGKTAAGLISERAALDSPTMDLDAIVVNAAHMKALPGRKTDVKDAEWIADLLRHGLLKASYIPSREQRELREITRYRKKPDRGTVQRNQPSTKDSGRRQHQIGLCGQRHQRKECQKAVGKDH